MSQQIIIMKKEYEQGIIEKYKNGLSSCKIAKEYNISTDSVQKILHNNGIVLRKPTDNKRQYTLNVNFFDDINTEEKAYFLGFLYADGNVSKKSNAIRLSLQDNDKEILEKLNKIIGSNKPLYYDPPYTKNNYSYSGRYTLSIFSKHMKESVMKLGLVPKKTHILTFPEWLNSNLYNHFIRGVFDGDGSLSHKTKIDSYSFSLAGTKSFLSKVQEILMKECELNQTKLTPVKSIYVLNYGGSKQVIRIRDFLYKNATIFLKRKKDKFDEVIVKEDYATDKEIVDAYNNFNTNTDAAEFLGINDKTIARRMRKYNIARGRDIVFSEEQEKEMIRLYIEELKTAIEIGKQFETSHTRVYKVLRKHGIKIRDSHGPLETLRNLEPHKEEIVYLYISQQKPANFILKKFNVSQITVIKFLKDNKVPIRGQHELMKSILEDKKEEVISMLQEGKKVYEIAAYYKITEAVVRKFFRRWNISSREIKRNIA